MEPMKIKGAIFDMDGTLVDSLFFWNFFWKSLGKRFLNQDDFVPAVEVDKHVRALNLHDSMQLVKDHYGISEPVETLLAFAYEGLEDWYRNHAKVKDGVVSLLEHLKSLGIPMCVASATDIYYVRLALKHHGIAHYFDEIISCTEVGAGKDRPDVFLYTAKKMGLPAEDICVFEDSFMAVETAHNAGFLTVGIFDPYNNFEPARLRAASNLRVDEGQTMEDLIPLITK